MNSRCLPWLLCLFASAACTADRTTIQGCEAPVVIGTFPDNVREVSGLVISRRHPDLLWVNNDGETETLFGIDTTGNERSRVQVLNAPIHDWEDLAIAQCGDRDCLYIADIGDNLRTRQTATIYRIPEPDPADTVTEPAQAFRFRYPDEPHDAEAIFVMPGERVFIITKGRSELVTLYRYPGPLRDEVVTLEPVQTLSPGIVQFPDMVTGAAAAPDGRTVAVRTYAWLQIYDFSGDSLNPLLPGPLDLTALREPQGEAIGIREDGTIFLGSEQGLSLAAAPLSRLHCAR